MATLGTLAEKRFAGQVARKGRDKRQHRMPHTATHANRNTRTRTQWLAAKTARLKARLLRRNRWKDSSRARNGREFPWSHATPRKAPHCARQKLRANDRQKQTRKDNCDTAWLATWQARHK
ncbi:hypothetical protein, conserved in T. vivax [Trypanosoma vivax Y486]|uniref:Uncharacterized protein n=1 Tax=Trypanosoma vivax (strain Y486) TaxID=1055687 RepID=F9WP67_TRYVY|nr:hypothetical protein, conserved in T. vivax [Trypanosoma vivax Y486]|eukprot:CCD19341.1 hypothetical protein, conserved in T. vivax [Trypanosoma vivax Y486]